MDDIRSSSLRESYLWFFCIFVFFFFVKWHYIARKCNDLLKFSYSGKPLIESYISSMVDMFTHSDGINRWTKQMTMGSVLPLQPKIMIKVKGEDSERWNQWWAIHNHSVVKITLKFYHLYRSKHCLYV